MKTSRHTELRFCMGRAKGRLVQHERAIADAEAIREFVQPLAEAGHTLRYIGAWLDARRVVGPMGAQWHPETVGRLLDRLCLRERRAA